MATSSLSFSILNLYQDLTELGRNPQRQQLGWGGGCLTDFCFSPFPPLLFAVLSLQRQSCGPRAGMVHSPHALGFHHLVLVT